MTSLSKALTALFLVSMTVSAQWYDHPPGDLGYVPPVGWTYVLHSDSSLPFSSNINDFVCRHDSICYTVRTLSIDNSHTNVSLNGGKDVFSVSPFYRYTNDSLSGLGEIYPGSLTKFMLIQRTDQSGIGSKYLCANSTDFGESFSDEHYFSESVQNYLQVVGARGSDLRYHFVDCSPNNIYLSVNHGEGIYDSDDWFISKDRGMHWNMLSFPYVPGRGGRNRDIVFDQFNPGVWYVVIQPGNESVSACTVFRTVDDGLSFSLVFITCEQIDPGPPNVPRVTAGKLGPNTIRVPLTAVLLPSGRVSVGVKDFNDSGRVIRTSNWLHVIAPTKVNNSPKGYSFGIRNVLSLASDTTSGDYIITTEERIPNDTVAKKFITVTRIYRTTDDGSSWTELPWAYSSLINNISFDLFTNTLWAFASFDDEHQPITSQTSVHLWKYTGVSTVVKDESDESTDGAFLFPNPTSDKVTVRYNTSDVGIENISIHDAFGRLVTKNNYKVIRKSAQECEIEIAKSLWDGKYYFHAVCGDRVLILPLIILR